MNTQACVRSREGWRGGHTPADRLEMSQKEAESDQLWLWRPEENGCYSKCSDEKLLEALKQEVE